LRIFSRTPLTSRRRLLAVGVVIVFLLVVMAGAWFLWLPGYRPALLPGENYGIDVSNHQGRIDWRQVAGDNISFAYIKATEGTDFVDRWFAVNWKAAGKAGLARGAYHFFSLCSPGPAQARNYLSTVPRDPTALPPAVDLELAGNCHRRPGRAAVDSQLRAFLQTVEAATGRRVVIYLGGDFAHRYPLTAAMRRPLWLARFLRPPSGNGWLMWQVDGFAHVNGVRGRVDLDIMRGVHQAARND
jgi:lysozyme